MKALMKRIGPRLAIVLLGIPIVVVSLVWFWSVRAADRSILTDVPCAAPCWQGITPGVPVGKDEILETLHKLPDVSHVTEYSREIRWRWRQWPWRRTGYNSIYWVGGTTHYISLSVGFELTLEEILDKYGLPESTNAVRTGVPEHRHVGMNLFYPGIGLCFRAEVYPWDRPVLEPTTKIFEIVYGTPAETVEGLLDTDTETMGLQPWPGYGKLEGVLDPLGL